MRKGELIGMRKEDVDVKGGTIRVCRSYAVDTTKGKHADLLPIADSLRPYLEMAMRASPSALLFPRSDGKMHERSLTLEDILRRALAKAGLVDGYVLKCRRKGCGYHEPRGTPDQVPCPKCNFRLWPSPVHRKVRFHDLRHTTATLLLKEGVSLATVQRVLRHTDPRITSSVYGHLDVEDMRKAVNKLPVSPLRQDAIDVETARAAASRQPVTRMLDDDAPLPPNFGGQVVDNLKSVEKEAATPLKIPSEIAALVVSGRRDLNSRLPAPKSEAGRMDGVAPRITGPQGVGPIQESGSVVCVPVTPIAPACTPFGGPVVDTPEHLLTVRDVAEILQVCPATVYKLVKKGSLQHVRVGNAVRVPTASLRSLVTSRSATP
jgi:excisionase family DNA binding protein